MQKVFFFHCPKAGGTSISTALQELTPQHLISPNIENDMVGHSRHSSYGTFRGYQLYTGHYGKDIFDQVNNSHSTITNFRHPAARIVSLYNFFRYHVEIPDKVLQEERYAAIKFSKENSFRDFVTCDDSRVAVYTRNQHVRQLTRSPWENSPGDYDKAQRLVLDMVCYYICEYPDLSMIWLRAKLRLKKIAYENKTIETDNSIRVSVLDPEIVELIYQNNADDLRLYRFAVDLFLARKRDC